MFTTLNLQIEDISSRIDYRLVYKFRGCRICEAKGIDTNIQCGTYIHRTQKEVDAGVTHNIWKYHGQLNTKDCHMEKPIKHCNFCKTLYNYDDSDCPKCWARVKDITSNELAAEYYEKQIAKLNRNKGILTIQEKEVQISEWNTAIVHHRMEAAKLKQHD